MTRDMRRRWRPRQTLMRGFRVASWGEHNENNHYSQHNICFCLLRKCCRNVPGRMAFETALSSFASPSWNHASSPHGQIYRLQSKPAQDSLCERNGTRQGLFQSLGSKFMYNKRRQSVAGWGMVLRNVSWFHDSCTKCRLLCHQARQTSSRKTINTQKNGENNGDHAKDAVRLTANAPGKDNAHRTVLQDTQVCEPNVQADFFSFFFR